MEQKKVTGISKYLPAFGVKGWGIALMGMAFYYFYQGPLHFAINFYYGYFEALYGWTNSQLAAAITIGQLVGVAGIFIWGPLNKKLGSKKVAIIGLLGGAISTMFFAFAPSIPTFYLSVILFCFFAVAYSQIAVATFAANWFPRTRGMYMGMATMGLTIGNATVTLVTSKMVPVYGVKVTLIMWSTLMVIVAILVALFAKTTLRKLAHGRITTAASPWKNSWQKQRLLKSTKSILPGLFPQFFAANIHGLSPLAGAFA